MGLYGEQYGDQYGGAADTLVPFARNQSPAPGASNVLPDAHILLEVQDAGTGVDPSTVVLTVDSVVAWQNDAPANGWAGARTAVPYGHGTGGFAYDLTPPALLSQGSHVVRVEASDNNHPPWPLDIVYFFGTEPDEKAPWVAFASPAPNATDVQADLPLTVVIEDDLYLVQSTLKVWVRGALAWDGSAGGVQPGWGHGRSRLETTRASLALYPTARWASREIVSVALTAEDAAGNVLNQSWLFTAAEIVPFVGDTYAMVLRSVRAQDERSPGLLYKLLKGFDGEDNGVDSVWRRFIYERASTLWTVFDPEAIGKDYLPLQLPLVGFTPDIYAAASVDEMRRMLASGIVFWKSKPTPSAVAEAVRMVTGERFTVRDYFDLHFQGDTTSITEELEDYDPNVLDFGDDVLHGDDLDVTGADAFTINDLPGGLGVYGFSAADQFLWLQVLSGAAVGTYAVRVLAAGGFSGTVQTLFAATPVTSAPWRLLGGMSDYTTEVRIADKATAVLELVEHDGAVSSGDTIIGQTSGARALVESVSLGSLGLPSSVRVSLRNLRGRFSNGERVHVNTGPATHAAVMGVAEGAVNIDLLGALLNAVRPSCERFDVVFVSFIEAFNDADDLGQWTSVHLTGGTPTVVLEDGTGYAEAAAGSALASGANGDHHEDWGDQSVAWKVQAVSAASVLRGYFLSQDTTLDDAYYWELDYAAQTIRLWKSAGGAPTAIGAAASLAGVVFPAQQDTVRVDAVREGSSTRIRVKVDGEEFLNVLDATYSKGRVGFAATGAAGRLLFVEVNALPTSIVRVGPR